MTEEQKQKKRDYAKAWREANKNYGKAWREANKNYGKEWRDNNKDYMKDWYQANEDYMKNWFQNNKEKQKLYIRNKRANNFNYKLYCNLKSRIKIALKENPRYKSTLEYIGCSIEELKQHLANKFTDGMSFDNYGKWHIDHIKPCSAFDLSKLEEQEKCFNYTNLQPL